MSIEIEHREGIEITANKVGGPEIVKKIVYDTDEERFVTQTRTSHIGTVVVSSEGVEVPVGTIDGKKVYGSMWFTASLVQERGQDAYVEWRSRDIMYGTIVPDVPREIKEALGVE